MAILLGPRRPCPTCGGTGSADAQLALIPELDACGACLGFLEAEDTEDEIRFMLAPESRR